MVKLVEWHAPSHPVTHVGRGSTVMVGVTSGQHLPTQPTVKVDLAVCIGQWQMAVLGGQATPILRNLVTVGHAGAIMVCPCVVVVLRGHSVGNSGAKVTRA